ncbi:MAG: hypothetical protein Q7T56_10150 [Nocardioidaceae bacterium]|nr:hypothetical protein [Nocardioidaceae bacterium]
MDHEGTGRSAAGRLEAAVRRAVRTSRRHARRLLAQMWVLPLRASNRWSRRPVTGDAPVAVSLTTYGARLATVAWTIESIAWGVTRPQRLVLWLDEPAALARPPRALRRLVRRGLEIRPTPDYGPHKKYYPYAASRSRHDLPLVTADDDVLYPPRWLLGLVAAHTERPDVVSCFRASVVAVAEGRLLPYDRWPRCTDTVTSATRFATGVSGVVYPPSLLDELARRGTAFQQVAPRADDLWLHWVALQVGTPVRQVSARPRQYAVVPGSQATSLVVENLGAGGGNDQVVARLYDADDVARLARAAREHGGR